MKRLPFLLALLLPLSLVIPSFGQAQAGGPTQRLILKKVKDRLGEVSRGTYRVFENREKKAGREIHLDIQVLHALSPNPKPDPIFFMAGGPGQGAANVGGGFANSPLRKQRDIVLVNQRGTGGDNLLSFTAEDFGFTEGGLQKHLEPMFQLNHVKSARDRLSKSFDLAQYSTPIAMDDLNEVREALGYDKINLIGGSYGTRASLVYIRRHGDTVRTATLSGLAPIPFTNPLYHAESAQLAINKIFDEVESNELYRKNLPGLREKFNQLMAEFEQAPKDIEVTIDGKTETVSINRDAFANAVRFQMYYIDTSRKLPVLLWRAVQGNMKPLVESSIRRNRGIGNSIALGMLMSVTSAEDLARINPTDVASKTSGTFLGGGRVTRQLAAAEIWPKSTLPAGFGDAVQSNVPTLIISGTIDPVTPPKWGELVHKNFPNSVHIVAPGAHDVGGGCINRIRNQFLESGTVEGLDLSCVKQMKLPPLYLPKENFQKK